MYFHLHVCSEAARVSTLMATGISSYAIGFLSGLASAFVFKNFPGDFSKRSAALNESPTDSSSRGIVETSGEIDSYRNRIVSEGPYKHYVWYYDQDRMEDVLKPVPSLTTNLDLIHITWYRSNSRQT